METVNVPAPEAPSQPPVQKNKLIPAIVALVVLIGLGVVMSLSVGKRGSQKGITMPPVPSVGPSLTPTLIPHPVLGSMTLKTKDGQTRYQAGKPVTLVIQASSEGRHIVGYDAILSYDGKGFTLQGATSVASGFQLYSYDRKTYVSFSGIRSLQNSTADSWSSFPLIEAVMVPKTKGNYTFELSPEGKEASKLVDDKAQVVYPKTMELHLEIY